MASKISEFVDKQNAFNDRLDIAITGISEDVSFLKAKIEELQNSPGSISPEDQASLDALESRVAAMTARIEALNALTPPVPPVEPVV